MPKKTKKEKIITQYRKRLKILEQQTKTVPLTFHLKTQSQPNFEEKNNLPVKPNSLNLSLTKPSINNLSPQKISLNDEIKKVDTEAQKIFFLDLKKSLFLSILIIGLEIILYFVRIIK
ncbi:MAG: hypothetical protein N2482_01900 [Patescibacteria group bacterium]|nr:hypothetical protein [Patescibacteria group bacterium]